MSTTKKRKKKPAPAAEAEATPSLDEGRAAQVVPLKPQPNAEAPSELEEEDRALGWTPIHTAVLKHAMTIEAMSREIDREVGHLAAGIVALFEGHFELACLNLWHAGLAVAPPPSVEEAYGDPQDEGR